MSGFQTKWRKWNGEVVEGKEEEGIKGEKVGIDTQCTNWRENKAEFRILQKKKNFFSFSLFISAHIPVLISASFLLRTMSG